MAIDLRRETPNVAKHIVNAINSMAKIKQEQIKVQQSAMLDQIERKRDLKDYQAKKDINAKSKQGEQQGLIDMLSGGQQPQQTPTMPQTVSGPQGGQITGQAEGQTPTATRLPVWRGVDLRPPGSKGSKMTMDDIRYAGIYKKIVSGEDISETNEKTLLKYNEEGKVWDKFREVLGNVEQGGVFNKRTGEVLRLDKEQAEAYAQSELGSGWQKKFPEIKKAISEKFGGTPRDEAIKALTNKGYPVTEANITALMKQSDSE